MGRQPHRLNRPERRAGGPARGGGEERVTALVLFAGVLVVLLVAFVLLGPVVLRGGPP